MALRKILSHINPSLHMKCKPVEKFDEKLHKLLDDMRETLIESGGVGLAAPRWALSAGWFWWITVKRFWNW